MKKIYFILFWVFTFSLLANVNVGKVINISGRAFLQKENSAFKSLKFGDLLENGDIVKTSNNAKVKILFIDNSIIYISSKTQFKIEKYVYDKKKQERSSVLNLFTGRIKLLVAKLSFKKRNFKVKTDTATVGVRGTEFIVSTEAKNESEILVLSGSVEVMNPLDKTQKSVLLSKNDIIKSIGNLPIASPSKATKEDFKRLTNGLNIPTLINLKLNYKKLFKHIKLKNLLKMNKLRLIKIKKSKTFKSKREKRVKRRQKRRLKRQNIFKNGYLAPNRIKTHIDADIKGE